MTDPFSSFFFFFFFFVPFFSRPCERKQGRTRVTFSQKEKVKRYHNLLVVNDGCNATNIHDCVMIGFRNFEEGKKSPPGVKEEPFFFFFFRFLGPLSEGEACLAALDNFMGILKKDMERMK